jgi:hypothetical protein
MRSYQAYTSDTDQVRVSEANAIFTYLLTKGATMKTTQNAIVASFSCDILYAITYHFFGD